MIVVYTYEQYYNVWPWSTNCKSNINFKSHDHGRINYLITISAAMDYIAMIFNRLFVCSCIIQIGDWSNEQRFHGEKYHLQ